MKNCALLLVVVAATFTGCQKEMVEKPTEKMQTPNPANTVERRLIKTETHFTSDNIAYLTIDSFNYDWMGRVANFFRRDNNFPAAKIADIIYEGSTASIKYTRDNYLPGQIDFVFNSSNQPIKQLLLIYLDSVSPNYSFKDYYRDTTEYMYENGFLTQMSSSGVDTKLVSDHGAIQNTYINRATITHFIVENGVLKSSHEDDHQDTRDEKGSVITYSSNSFSSDMSFQYTRQYPNNLVQTNQILLQTCYAYSFLPSIPFNSYQMIPDQTDIKWNWIDENGQAGNRQFTNALTLEYNEKGLLRCNMTSYGVVYTVDYYFE